ncbi:flagellar assembly protein FliW [Halarcobacter sp.]|uniref:flagellar assembly protein FliW n=1 Tax=Halarcobacter sp. TaxID=2321133 RepID=UPI003A9110EA
MKFEVVTPIDGFEREKEFELSKLDDFFFMIKGVETGETIRLMSFGALKSLEFELPEDFIAKLEIEDISDISIFYIFVLQAQTSDSSMNIFAPLIMNNKSMKMGQIHLDLQELGLDSLNDVLPKF